jgi:hypothetical protein
MFIYTCPEPKEINGACILSPVLLVVSMKELDPEPSIMRHGCCGVALVDG